MLQQIFKFALARELVTQQIFKFALAQELVTQQIFEFALAQELVLQQIFFLVLPITQITSKIHLKTKDTVIIYPSTPIIISIINY